MVRAIMIIEIAGKPPKHVKESLQKYVRTLDEIKDLELHSIKISEPKKIKDSNGMFTCFAEVEFETETFLRMAHIMFDYMPSSVEVIEPSTFKFSAPEASELLNNISGRLHRYDEIAKMAHGRIMDLTRELEGAGKVLPKISFEKKIKKDKTKKKSVKKK